MRLCILIALNTHTHTHITYTCTHTYTYIETLVAYAYASTLYALTHARKHTHTHTLEYTELHAWMHTSWTYIHVRIQNILKPVRLAHNYITNVCTCICIFTRHKCIYMRMYRPARLDTGCWSSCSSESRECRQPA